ncbi:MAG: [Fe-Fe] hydrogenase large subunit C-terminal domain-containing protein, partial [Syntrophomonadaceae bacterium]|nr:[Fe-Fe] hydrogenase large subunit C-terminal domain-containing protein [Syntrophomonadaceae bacterium]
LPMEQLVTALRRAGIHYVLHTNFTADLTIMEEGNELLKRVKQGGVLPMVTSCCPSWIRFAEIFYPNCLDHLSTCKSPQQMFGALVKTYWAEQMDIDPARIYSVSIMPCTAKKYEAQRPEMEDSGYRDVDLVLTTREIVRLFKMMGIDPVKCEPSRFDPWMSEYSGAAVLFGTTGGVMEAALRTVYEVVSGDELDNIDFTVVRGMEGIREAEVDLNGQVLKVAVVHGLGNARYVMEQVKAGKSPYHFIEVMACPGGCIGGGGQPFTTSNKKRVERNQAIYAEDAGMAVRKSHENSDVAKVYKEFLHEPLGALAHKFLHTDYEPIQSAIDSLLDGENI